MKHVHAYVCEANTDISYLYKNVLCTGKHGKGTFLKSDVYSNAVANLQLPLYHCYFDSAEKIYENYSIRRFPVIRHRIAVSQSVIRRVVWKSITLMFHSYLHPPTNFSLREVRQNRSR